MLRRPLFVLMQADPKILPLIDEYMMPFAAVFPLLLTMMGVNGVLRGQGMAKAATGILLAYSAVNWVLDPILISGAFGFEGFGMAGAAYATGGGWVVAVITAFALLHEGSIPFDPGSFGGAIGPRGCAP